MRILAFTVCYVFGIAAAVDLPSYIPQCSLSDKHLNYCIVDVANIVIPYIVQGDKEIGIPVTNPGYFKKGEFLGNNLTISMTDAYTYDLKNIRLTNASFDLKKKKASFDATLDIFNAFTDYSITNGQLLSRTFSGRGKFAFTLIDSTLRCDADLQTYEKDGEMHVEFLNTAVKLTTDRAYFEFTGLHSPEKGQDIDEFIRKNWQQLYIETKPSIEKRFALTIMSVLEPIAKKVPVLKVFTA